MNPASTAALSWEILRKLIRVALPMPSLRR